MKTFIATTFTALIIVICSFAVNNNERVCPTIATMTVTESVESEYDWAIGSIYDITFSEECPMLRGKEVLLSAPLFDAILTILHDRNTAYGDFQIEYKYIPNEGIYIANLLDSFIEL